MHVFKPLFFLSFVFVPIVLGSTTVQARSNSLSAAMIKKTFAGKTLISTSRSASGIQSNSSTFYSRNGSVQIKTRVPKTGWSNATSGRWWINASNHLCVQRKRKGLTKKGCVNVRLFGSRVQYTRTSGDIGTGSGRLVKGNQVR